MAAEFEFIETLRKRSGQHPMLKNGIGDDTAVLAMPADQLVTCDQLLDGVHFRTEQHDLKLIGRKCLAVSLSDIAAMAGVPDFAFVSVAFPQNFGMNQAKRLFEGISLLANEFGVVVAGGDTTSWPGKLAVNITVVGHSEQPPVSRRGAQVGDAICVTGPLGGSLAGHHLSFVPRVREAQILNKSCRIHSMIDISDGVGSDLHHILRESRCGATVDAAAVPISEAARTIADDRSPLEHALHDGEDFELLFTMSESECQRVANDPLDNVDVFRIGTVRQGPGCDLIHEDGSITPLRSDGWQHSFGE